MFKIIFQGVFDNGMNTELYIFDFLMCIGAALLLGLCIAFCYRVQGSSTQSFVITLALLPAIVCMVILMVNGNIGAGVAVAGAFSKF